MLFSTFNNPREKGLLLSLCGRKGRCGIGAFSSLHVCWVVGQCETLSILSSESTILLNKLSESFAFIISILKFKGFCQKHLSGVALNFVDNESVKSFFFLS